MRVLVTGATGFLGRHLIPLLRRHDVVSLVHPDDRSVPPDGVRTVVGDLSQNGAWREQVVQFEPEWCFHLAWEGLPDYSLAWCRKNVDASLALLETLVTARVRRVVVAGSGWEYGRAFGPVTEEQAPVECGVFATAKHAVRTMLDSVSREAGFDYRWARIFFVYGPGQRSTSLIPHLHASFAAGQRPVLRHPHAVQDFVHVDDVVRGLVSLAECHAVSGIFNLGTGKPTSVSQVANLVAGHFDQQGAFDVAGDGEGFWADTARSYAAAGWCAEIGIADGVARALAALAVSQ